MRITSRQTALILCIAGTGYVIGAQLFALYKGRNQKIEIGSQAAKDLAAICYAAGVLNEEVDAGNYRPNGPAQIRRDVEGLIKLYDPENK